MLVVDGVGGANYEIYQFNILFLIIIKAFISTNGATLRHLFQTSNAVQTIVQYAEQQNNSTFTSPIASLSYSRVPPIRRRLSTLVFISLHIIHLHTKQQQTTTTNSTNQHPYTGLAHISTSSQNSQPQPKPNRTISSQTHITAHSTHRVYVICE